MLSTVEPFRGKKSQFIRVLSWRQHYAIMPFSLENKAVTKAVMKKWLFGERLERINNTEETSKQKVGPCFGVHIVRKIQTNDSIQRKKGSGPLQPLMKTEG